MTSKNDPLVCVVFDYSKLALHQVRIYHRDLRRVPLRKDTDLSHDVGHRAVAPGVWWRQREGAHPGSGSGIRWVVVVASVHSLNCGFRCCKNNWDVNHGVVVRFFLSSGNVLKVLFRK